MKIARFTALLGGFALAASAANTTSYVASTGSDSNACTKASPCATFQRAYNQTTYGGAVIALTGGDFGGVAINGSITIDGGGTGAYIGSASSGGSLINVTASQDSVSIRNLALLPPINGTPLSASLNLASVLNIENVAVLGGGSNLAVNGFNISAQSSGMTVSLRNVSLGPSFGSNLACHGGRVELRNVSSAGTAGSNFFNQPVLTIDGCQTVIRDSSFQGASYTAIYLAAGSAPSNIR